jgi:hypothetical protein
MIPAGDDVDDTIAFYEQQQFPLCPNIPIRPMSEGSLEAI